MRKYLVEFIGTFFLVFTVCAAVLSKASLAPIAIGAVLAAMVFAGGHISGGHFNPAITFGFLITRRIKPPLAVVYWLAQFGGAALAALLVRDLLPRASTEAVKLGVPALGGGVDAGAGFALEAIFTFFLVWAVFATAVDPRGAFKSIAGLAIGLTITIDILFGGPLTGAAMNPARAFGPQLVGNHWSDGWVWYAGPVLGASVAAALYELLYLRPARPEAGEPA